MRIEIVSKDYHVSERLNEVLTKKLNKFDKYFQEEATAKVVCREGCKGLQTMEVTITFSGRLVRAEVTSANMYDNIDILLPKIESQVWKYRTKLEKKLRKGGMDELLAMSSEVKENVDKLVRVKQFELVPMNVESAIMELELLGHDFFIFLNEVNGRVNVIYKRDSGDYGLLDGIK